MTVSQQLLSAIAAALVAAVGTTAGAQTPHAAIHITARDSSGAPVTDAELMISRGLHDVVARGRTDSTGNAVLVVDAVRDEDYSLTMRKIGYARGDRVFDLSPHDTTPVAITVGTPRSSTLAPVKVTAQTDLRAKSYHLTADDIENSDWQLYDGWDVVKRLRPDMLTSRGGCSTGVQNIWVNGKWIRLPLPPIGMAATQARVGVPQRARFSYAAVSVLSEIAPEHIQEITYRDCWDTTMSRVGTQNAIFVTLKPGVTYQQDVGSFVLDSLESRPNTR